MVKNVYTIRDIMRGDYSEHIFTAHTHGEAERSFRELVLDKNTLLSKYPEHYSLFQIGQFDSNTGLVKSLDMPQHLVEATSIKQQSATQ